MFPVDVSPDMSMYILLKSQGYDPAYALAEFIDNALQAHISTNQDSATSKPLEISLFFKSQHYSDKNLKNSIIIKDNGPGITKNQLIQAMRPARPIIANNGLSGFGIGMKAAAVWFTDHWQLRTKPISENYEYVLDFNLDSLINNNMHNVNTEEIEKTGTNGTEIILNHVRKAIDKPLFGVICQDLKEIYQKFTSGESPQLILKAYFDTECHSLTFENEYKALNQPIFKKIKGKLYAIGENQEWKTDISISFQGVPIKGFMCIRDPGSYSKNPGLVMFRYNRVIQGLSAKKFMPLKLYKSHNKHEAQRIYGEFQADELPVTYTKDKFEIDDEAFALELINLPEVKTLLQQAKDYRTAEKDFTRIESELELTKKPTNNNGTMPPNGVINTPNPSNVTNADNPTSTVPTDGSNPASKVPTNVATPTSITPTNVVANPINTAPNDVITSPVSTPSTDVANLTEEPVLPVAQLDDISKKRLLIKPEMLIDSFQTDAYCLDLIKQINWVFEYKRAFKEIVLVALRNLLENHLDYTFGHAFPDGNETKFDEKFKKMLEVPLINLNQYSNTIQNLFNQTSRGYQTQKNLHTVNFSEKPSNELISALHLSAHKGANIVNLDQFVNTYGKQYNLLLELLTCVARYNKTIAQRSES